MEIHHQAVPQPRAHLREKALQLRQIARNFPADPAANELGKMAAELEKHASALEAEEDWRCPPAL